MYKLFYFELLCELCASNHDGRGKDMFLMRVIFTLTEQTRLKFIDQATADSRLVFTGQLLMVQTDGKNIDIR